MPTKNAKSRSTSPQDFLDRLQRYPELQAEFKTILDIVDNFSGDVVRADEAEGRVSEDLQRLGQHAIQTWASRKHQKLQAESDSHSDLTRKGKKTLLVHPLRQSRSNKADLPTLPLRSSATSFR